MSCKSGKCMRPGRITSNGYLNFLREYRKKNCGLTAVQTVTKGAKAWNKLSCSQKQKFRQMGCGAKKSKRRRSRSRSSRRSCSSKRKRRRSKRRSSCGRSKRRSSCGRRKRRSSCKRSKRRPKRRSKAKRCMRPGRITNNGYLNFLRKFRRTCCGLSPQETIRRGARKWCSLSQAEKAKYRRAGSKRRSKRRKC